MQIGTIKTIKIVNTIIAFICVILCIVYGAGYMQFVQGKLNDAYKALEANPAAALVVGTKEMLDASQYALTTQIFSKIISLFIFGIVPILYSLKHILFKSEK